MNLRTHDLLPSAESIISDYRRKLVVRKMRQYEHLH